MNEQYLYQKEWEKYRQLRNRQYIVFISGFLLYPVKYFGTFIGLNQNLFSTVEFFLTAVWIVALVYVVFRFHTWKCPACGERFFRRTFWLTMPELLNKCRSCELPKYAGSTLRK